MRFGWHVLAIFVLVLSSCSSSETSTPEPTGEQQVESSSTTLPPVILGLTPNLELQVDQCWADLPPPVTSATTIEPHSPEEESETPQTAPEPLGDLVSSIPVPTVVAEVACEGTNDGQVFATFCLGVNPQADDPTEPELVPAACDPAVEVEWPGDRALRRTAVRLCLQSFTQRFGQSYGQSDLVAKEFTPTEGIWNRGQRTVVCWVEPTA